MNTGVNVDQEARNMAQLAISQIHTHEAVCAERYGSTIKTMGEIKAILAYGTCALLSTMLVIIGWLWTHPPH